MDNSLINQIIKSLEEHSICTRSVVREHLSSGDAKGIIDNLGCYEDTYSGTDDDYGEEKNHMECDKVYINYFKGLLNHNDTELRYKL